MNRQYLNYLAALAMAGGLSLATAQTASPTTRSGLVSGGNEILATGTFTQNGVTKAHAARFIANPTGNTPWRIAA